MSRASGPRTAAPKKKSGPAPPSNGTPPPRWDTLEHVRVIRTDTDGKDAGPPILGTDLARLLAWAEAWTPNQPIKPLTDPEDIAMELEGLASLLHGAECERRPGDEISMDDSARHFIHETLWFLAARLTASVEEPERLARKYRVELVR